MEWISTKDKLPAFDEHVLLRFSDGSIIAGCRTEAGFVTRYHEYAAGAVPHWLPLPPPPTDHPLEAPAAPAALTPVEIEHEVTLFTSSTTCMCSARLISLATLVWMDVHDERVLELARSVVRVTYNMGMDAPDWVRILSEASDVRAVSDARDDLALEDGWTWLQKEVQHDRNLFAPTA